MGKIMSIMQRTAKKSLYNFNAENRAHRIISQSKPKPAPLHRSSEKELEYIKRDFPEFIKSHNIKDNILDDRLKNLYVLSKDDPNNILFKEDPSKPLPQNRKRFDQPEYGYIQPENVPPGKINLKNALKLLSDYESNKILNNPNQLALDYKLDLETINTLLKYYQVFEIYIPKKKETESFSFKNLLVSGEKK